MTTKPIKATKSNRPNLAWLWLLTLPAALGLAGFIALFGGLIMDLVNVEKSPSYALAVKAVTTHRGVDELLGGPRVTKTKGKFLHKTASGTTLDLTLELTGSEGQAIAEVKVSEKAGLLRVERATVTSPRGEFGLLADGKLQPLYDPKHALASGP